MSIKISIRLISGLEKLNIRVNFHVCKQIEHFWKYILVSLRTN